MEQKHPDPRQRRYTAVEKEKALQLINDNAGFSLHRIAKIVGKEIGIPISSNTINRWRNKGVPTTSRKPRVKLDKDLHSKITARAQELYGQGMNLAAVQMHLEREYDILISNTTVRRWALGEKQTWRKGYKRKHNRKQQQPQTYVVKEDDDKRKECIQLCAAMDGMAWKLLEYGYVRQVIELTNLITAIRTREEVKLGAKS